jgi:mRNA-degrading endonuclease toxin of MazEF toxin-antitoxin module
MTSRGDVVIVDFRPVHPAAGVRPALVIQNDRDNARMSKTIVAHGGLPARMFVMNQLAQTLDEKLRTLDPACARMLEALVRDALRRAEQVQMGAAASVWPEGYFEQTAGALAGEEFERPPQGDLPVRDDW